VTLSIAALRRHLYDIDLIINRALVYGALTATLAGLYSGSISLFQKVFMALTGERSDAAIVLTTLILASTFIPIKSRLQAIVDRRFRDVHDPLRRLTDFSKRVETGIWVVDGRLALAGLLEEAVAAPCRPPRTPSPARCLPRSNPPGTALADLGSLYRAEADALLRPRHSPTGLAGRSPPGAFHHA